jgi:hypothetical protein
MKLSWFKPELYHEMGFFPLQNTSAKSLSISRKSEREVKLTYLTKRCSSLTLLH